MRVFTSGHRNLVNEDNTTSSSGYRGPWSYWSGRPDAFYVASIHSVFERPVSLGLKFIVQVPDFLKLNDRCLKVIPACPRERFTSPDNEYISRFLHRKAG